MKQFLFVIFLVLSLSLTAQDRLEELKHSLDRMSETTTGLNETVEFSVNGVSIQEFLRGVATAHNLNVSIDPSIKVNVVNNFSNAKVSDVLLFLCKQYQLDINFIGSIMSFVAYVEPPKKAELIVAKKLKIKYVDQTDFLSIDLKKDSLDNVVREITKQSLKNIVLSPGLENELVSAYIQNRPFLNTLEKLAFANGLKVSATDDNFYLIEKIQDETNSSNQQTARRNRNTSTKSNSRNNNTSNEGIDVQVFDNDLITVSAKNAAITDIIDEVSAQSLKSYFLFSEPQGNTTLYIENATYNDFMTYLLNGTDYTYKVEEKVYLIGERKLERLRTTEMVQLENRTVESIIDFIPQELQEGVEIKEFIELNSLVLSGSHPQVHEIKKFIRQVDLVVPVVLIDVMVLDVSKSRALKTGLNMGIGERPTNGSGEGTLFPNINFGVSNNSVNDLINLFNGYGVFNLGKVVPDFYLNIDALESEGIINKRSTPKLATLNGHEATLSIGETEYYAEQSSNIIGSQNPTVANAIVYKPQNADLEVKIKPFVSGDNQVTMEISVSQSDFKQSVGENAPRGSVTVGFESLVRVKNQETILLGGLESKSTQNSGSGLPVLSRIPVLKWIFSNRSYSKEDNKLHVLIKPTIIY